MNWRHIKIKSMYMYSLLLAQDIDEAALNELFPQVHKEFENQKNNVANGKGSLYLLLVIV